MRWHRRWRSEAGSALVELAVALPVLVVVFVGTVDFARVFYTSMALTNAARAGAQYGAYDVARSGDNVGMKDAAENATRPSTTGIVATTARTCWCASNDGVFVGSTGVDCTAPAPAPPACNKGNHMVVTVTVTATKTFTTVMTGFPAIPSTVNLSRTATMRVHQ